MSEEPKTEASAPVNQPDSGKVEIREMVDYASRKFGEEYSKDEEVHTLIAQYELIRLVHAGTMSPAELKNILDDQSKFEAVLALSHAKFEARKDQEILTRLANLDKNTHWKIATFISFASGIITGGVIALASPFITTWLQPTADELFKRQSNVQAPAAVIQPQPVQNIITTNNYTTTNNVYNFNTPDTKPASSEQNSEAKLRVKLACKNATIENYNGSLWELLQRGDIVTLETAGKKVSLCYRPNQQGAARQSVLAK